MEQDAKVDVPLCTTEGCGKPSGKLACPQCGKFFCSQECFKSFWGKHKATHAPKKAPAPTLAPDEDEQVDEHLEQFAGYRFTGNLRPAKLSSRRTVPSEIPAPEYAEDGEPKIENRMRGGTSIEVRTAEEIETLRETCRMARDVLDLAGKMVQPGVTTDEIDKFVHEEIVRRGAYPSPLNYRGFPKSCCTSVNEVVCHGIPDSRPLEDGDIVNIDITVYYKGFHGDVNDTFFCGTIKPNALRLVKCTYESLDNAIKQGVKPGRLYRDVGNLISKHVTLNGFSVIRSYCGHGIGRLFHTAPNVPHYSKNKAVGIMKPGHVFTIEPMINEGSWKDVLWPDEWTSVTTDGKLSAQFEHTILVTEDGCEILTARTENSYVYPWMKK